MPRILLAQQDVALATIPERRLTADRYDTVVVQNCCDAMQQSREENYDLVIIDLELPALDGFKLLRQIRYAEVMTPVLATTALIEVDQRVRALDCGADDCLVKPIWYSEMTARKSERCCAARTDSRAYCGSMISNSIDWPAQWLVPGFRLSLLRRSSPCSST